MKINYPFNPADYGFKQVDTLNTRSRKTFYLRFRGRRIERIEMAPRRRRGTVFVTLDLHYLDDELAFPTAWIHAEFDQNGKALTPDVALYMFNNYINPSQAK